MQHKAVPAATANCVTRHKISCDSRLRYFRYVTDVLCDVWQSGDEAGRAAVAPEGAGTYPGISLKL